MRQLPLTAVVLDWRPVTMLGSTASLRVDGTAWLFALALLAAGGSVALAWQVIPDQGQPASSGSTPALTLAMLAVGLGSVFAANIITLFLCWGLLDGLFSLALLARGGPTSGRRAQFALGLNGLATLTVWVVAVLIEQARLSPYWHLLILPTTARDWMAAGRGAAAGTLSAAHLGVGGTGSPGAHTFDLLDPGHDRACVVGAAGCDPGIA